MPDLAIVGLGRIGSSYDAAPGAVPRSHIGAALAASGFHIRWLVDRDASARALARRQWPQLADASWMASIDELPAGEVDVIAFCTPPAERARELETAAKLGARVAIAEKPFCQTAEEALRLDALARKSGIEVRINYQRRFDPGHLRMKALCAGAPRKAVFRYSKGLFNYASHAVDLLLDWFGPIDSVQALDDRRGGDPNLSFRCRSRAGFDAYLLGIDDLAYDLFDADFFFADSRIELTNGGTERRVYRPAPGKYYAGYAHLDLDERATDIGPVGGMTELYQAVGQYLRTGTPLDGCTAHDAVAVLTVLEAAVRSRDEAGRVISVVDHASERSG